MGEHLPSPRTSPPTRSRMLLRRPAPTPRAFGALIATSAFFSHLGRSWCAPRAVSLSTSVAVRRQRRGDLIVNGWRFGGRRHERSARWQRPPTGKKPRPACRRQAAKLPLATGFHHVRVRGSRFRWRLRDGLVPTSCSQACRQRFERFEALTVGPTVSGGNCGPATHRCMPTALGVESKRILDRMVRQQVASDRTASATFRYHHRKFWGRLGKHVAVAILGMVTGRHGCVERRGHLPLRPPVFNSIA
jgi:hypothetical protein